MNDIKQFYIENNIHKQKKDSQGRKQHCFRIANEITGMTDGRIEFYVVKPTPPKKWKRLKGIKRCFDILEIGYLFAPVINSHSFVKAVEDAND
jgi:hypothetical protein